ncbi:MULTISPECIES: ACP S-malonyltransferase [Aerococcus]|uniref:Malonyl CoA-acyl carrier protein transacylase n=1 Tax=Aerococcus sanguinicola TaxID=119206 RepID=A0A5N1GLG3_9LACT|nr:MULTISPECIES: ACP S-malonyltransferase [Aerococcus]KAA9301815.1 ACP S-malonyltransferase [Aerococcus sanguinicola]MDK6368765.1 ACP S-malonyltransferase [Aerococcus sp. UMB9870]MDK6679313.1 ACP S-malonyltransferase [Aerococcus sp. UMB8608]MDK6685845.1 ACP S-malonyltransferase [Aerococcus sp. UMB8623]MDK6939388.1 ACP S-malonyltransferase [Aerococcus sp. UMB8487]
MSIAFMYSGQGAQFKGMGQDILARYPHLDTFFEEASAITSYDMKAICFEDDEKIHETEYTQPALITIEAMLSQCLHEAGIQADYSLGLSLGEYAALMNAGALSYATCMDLIRQRGKIMAEAVPSGLGKMVAVMNTPREQIEAACQEARSEAGAYVAPANYNTGKQVVIGGYEEAVDLACEKLKEAGSKKLIPLKVSGPFHTELMKPASENFKRALELVDFNPPAYPVISNTTARPHDMAHLKENLAKQMYSPVRWEDSIRYLLDQGVDTFIEIGPGKTLSSFMKQIDRSVACYRVGDLENLEKTINELAGE